MGHEPFRRTTEKTPDASVFVAFFSDTKPKSLFVRPLSLSLFLVPPPPTNKMTDHVYAWDASPAASTPGSRRERAPSSCGRVHDDRAQGATSSGVRRLPNRAWARARRRSRELSSGRAAGRTTAAATMRVTRATMTRAAATARDQSEESDEGESGRRERQRKRQRGRGRRSSDDRQRRRPGVKTNSASSAPKRARPHSVPRAQTKRPRCQNTRGW